MRERDGEGGEKGMEREERNGWRRMRERDGEGGEKDTVSSVPE